MSPDSVPPWGKHDVVVTHDVAAPMRDGVVLRANVWLRGHAGDFNIDPARVQHAHHAVAAAVGRLDGGRTTPVKTVLSPRLVIRGTTGPAM
jgi:hypothetical protein